MSIFEKPIPKSCICVHLSVLVKTVYSKCFVPHKENIRNNE